MIPSRNVWLHFGAQSVAPSAVSSSHLCCCCYRLSLCRFNRSHCHTQAKELSHQTRCSRLGLSAILDAGRTPASPCGTLARTLVLGSTSLQYSESSSAAHTVCSVHSRAPRLSLLCGVRDCVSLDSPRGLRVRAHAARHVAVHPSTASARTRAQVGLPTCTTV